VALRGVEGGPLYSLPPSSPPAAAAAERYASPPPPPLLRAGPALAPGESALLAHTGRSAAAAARAWEARVAHLGSAAHYTAAGSSSSSSGGGATTGLFAARPSPVLAGGGAAFRAHPALGAAYGAAFRTYGYSRSPARPAHYSPPARYGASAYNDGGGSSAYASPGSAHTPSPPPSGTFTARGAFGTHGSSSSSSSSHGRYGGEYGAATGTAYASTIGLGSYPIVASNYPNYPATSRLPYGATTRSPSRYVPR
jgi:hypothetical protein